MTYDLPLKVIETVKEIAEGEDVCQSDVAGPGADWMTRYRAGTVTIDDTQLEPALFQTWTTRCPPMSPLVRGHL